MRSLLLFCALFLLSGWLLADPTASPAAGTYTGAIYVTLNDATSGATICYRTDGTDPAATTPGFCDAGSTIFAGAVLVTSTTTFRALATKSGFTNSNIVSFTYTINQ